MLVAAFALVMFMFAALVVDLGVARDTRLQAQNAADAAALAAGNRLYVNGATPEVAAAVDAATAYGTRNFGTTAAQWAACQDPARPAGWSTVSGKTPCVSFNSLTAPSQIRVVMPARRVRTPLGSLAGVSYVDIDAIAQTALEPGTVTALGGLRPWGICSKVVNTSGTVTFVPMKGGSTLTGNAASGCGSSGPPGGWWVAQCTGQSNSNGATESAVLNGCPTSAYGPVPNQPNTTPAALYNRLTTACPKKSENQNCLASDPGNNFQNASEEWQTLVGQNITMPVFCFPPQCSQEAFTAQGQNASYGIYRLATVEICGFRFPPRSASTGWPVSGPCATANPNGYTSSQANDGLFLVVKKLEGGPGGTWQLSQPPTSLRLTR